MVNACHVDPAWQEYTRGITVFVEESELQPFAQAKLYGHNAGHALAAYLGHELGLTRIDELADPPDVLRFVRAAMLYESGVPLCRRYANVDQCFRSRASSHSWTTSRCAWLTRTCAYNRTGGP